MVVKKVSRRVHIDYLATVAMIYRRYKIMEIFHGLKFKSFIENSIKEKKELNESYQRSKRNKKERTTSEKLQEELEPIPPCPMSDE